MRRNSALIFALFCVFGLSSAQGPGLEDNKANNEPTDDVATTIETATLSTAELAAGSSSSPKENFTDETQENESQTTKIEEAQNENSIQNSLDAAEDLMQLDESQNKTTTTEGPVTNGSSLNVTIEGQISTNSSLKTTTKGPNSNATLSKTTLSNNEDLNSTITDSPSTTLSNAEDLNSTIADGLNSTLSNTEGLNATKTDSLNSTLSTTEGLNSTIEELNMTAAEENLTAFSRSLKFGLPSMRILNSTENGEVTPTILASTSANETLTNLENPSNKTSEENSTSKKIEDENSTSKKFKDFGELFDPTTPTTISEVTNRDLDSNKTDNSNNGTSSSGGISAWFEDEPISVQTQIYIVTGILGGMILLLIILVLALALSLVRLRKNIYSRQNRYATASNNSLDGAGGNNQNVAQISAHGEREHIHAYDNNAFGGGGGGNNHEMQERRVDAAKDLERMGYSVYNGRNHENRFANIRGDSPTVPQQYNEQEVI